MDNIQQLLTMLCGVGALCSIGLILIGMFAFRLLGRGSFLLSAIPMAFGLIRNMLPGGGNDEPDYEAPVRRIQSYQHPSTVDLQQKSKQTLDFDAQVAQRMSQQSNFDSDFSAQHAPPGYTPKGHPLPSANKPKESEDAQNAPNSNLPSSLGKSKLGERPNFDRRPDFDPFGNAQVDEDVAHKAGGIPAADKDIDLGEVDLPPNRRVGGRIRRDRRWNRNDSNQDEVFGGLLDEDGDGFAEL